MDWKPCSAGVGTATASLSLSCIYPLYTLPSLLFSLLTVHSHPFMVAFLDQYLTLVAPAVNRSLCVFVSALSDVDRLDHVELPSDHLFILDPQC